MTVLKRWPLPFVEGLSNSRQTNSLKSSVKYHQRGIASYLDRLIRFRPLSSNLSNEELDRVQTPKETRLQRFFSTFPSERLGVGLLLLRALVGCSLIALGIGYVQTANHSAAAWSLAGISFISGGFLLAGLMTPLVAGLVAAVGIGIALSLIPLPSQAVFDGYLAIIHLIVLSIAIALLGPGAFSVDARMFGRREIPIPSSRDMPRP